MSSTWQERPTVFECDGDRLIGIIALPAQPIETGVIIIVGGPQYRAGSHRQFTLLARYLAEQGIASIRFDYRGMGDSEGDMRNFEAIDADIKAALDTLTTQTSVINQVVLWGLCDAASAALYYGHTDHRVKGLVLLNPWVHTEAGAARSRIKHYYLARLLSKAFWVKLFTGKVKMGASIAELADSARKAREPQTVATAIPSDPRHGSPGYIERMRKSMQKYTGKVMIILSGNDLTAQEFLDLVKNDKQWNILSNRSQVQHAYLSDANHTFSANTWRKKVGELSSRWVVENLTLNERPVR